MKEEIEKVFEINTLSFKLIWNQLYRNTSAHFLADLLPAAFLAAGFLADLAAGFLAALAAGFLMALVALAAGFLAVLAAGFLPALAAGLLVVAI